MGVKLSEWRLKITESVERTMNKINASADKSSAKFAALQDKITKFREGVSSAIDEVPGLNRVIEMAKNPYIAIAAGVLALGTALYSSTSMAMDFEKGMAQVNTTAQLTPQKLDQLKDKLLDMGRSSTVDILKIPEAFNGVISAVGDVDQSLKIFQPALKASRAGFTDIKTVVEAATNTLGSVKDATPTEVFDTLFATMRVGKAEFKDIAAFLPKIIPFSNNLGMSFKETAGAFALLTAKGQSVEATTTMLQNVFRALANPDRVDDFKALGVAIFDNAGKMRPFASIIEDTSKKLSGLSDASRVNVLSSLGLDSEAASGLAVLSQNVGQLKEFIGETTNSVGAMDDAFNNSLNSADRLTMLQNEFKAIMIQVGYKVLPYFNAALSAVNGTMNFLKDNFGTIKAVAQGLVAGLAVLGAAWVYSNIGMISAYVTSKLLVVGLKGISVAIMNIPIIGWVAALISALVIAYQTSDKFRAIVDGIGSMLASLLPFMKAIGLAMLNIANPVMFAQYAKQAVAEFKKIDLKGAFNVGYDESLAESAANRAKEKAPGSGDEFAGLAGAGSGAGADGLSVGKNPKIEKGLDSVTDGGKNVRNITVNIDSLVKEIKVQAATMQETAVDIERIVLETLVRAVNGAEQAMQ